MRLQGFRESVTKTEVDRSCNRWELKPVLPFKRHFSKQRPLSNAKSK